VIFPRGRTEQDRNDCNDVGGWGSFGPSLLCFVIIPFWKDAMIAGRPVRAVFIILCAVLLYLPARMYFHSPPECTITGVLSTLFPVWLLIFGYLCTKEGRDQERARAGRERKRSPPDAPTS
jgi:hypothetical protein